jgi:hypothetical protein
MQLRMPTGGVQKAAPASAIHASEVGNNRPATFGNLRDLQMGIDEPDWPAPWRPLATEQEAIGLQRQLDREVTARHPLFGRGATVKCRRIDNDDIVVVLFDRAYVVVHLTWSESDGGPFADKYPEWLSYGSLEDFVAAMLKHSRAYGDG